VAKSYLERLSQIVDQLEPFTPDRMTLETKHFFGGAALYANGMICASLSRAGFAVKLQAEVRQDLINEGKASEFRFFPKGPIKREYIALSESIIEDEKTLRKLIETSFSYAARAPGSDKAIEK
jgi:TfoX/Sxy family transcriptional regulator of competence genes